MSDRIVLAPADVHPASGYSHGWKVGNTIYVAGQVALDINGQIVGKGDFAAQCVQVYENLKRVLAAGGASLSDVVKTTTFITDLAHRQILREIRPRYFSDPSPAGTLVVISSLASPDYLLEIEAIAVV